MRSIFLVAACATAIGFAPGGMSIAMAGQAQTAALAGPAAAQEVPKKADTSRRICRNITPTGSRMSTRYCRSQADWDADAERARRNQETGSRNGSSRDGEFEGLNRL